MSEGESELFKNRRLWIGNLDLSITEYQLLKLVQKYGTIEKFDLLFHRTGPYAGQSRGYAFVTYLKEEEAEHAKKVLHNIRLGQKRINVTWAYCIKDDEIIKPVEKIVIPVLALAKPEVKNDRESQIQAIEAKLKLMEERHSEELKINDTLASKAPVIAHYQQKKLESKPNSSVKVKLSERRRLKTNRKNYAISER